MTILLWICVGINTALALINATQKYWGMAAVHIGMTLFCVFAVSIQG